MLYLSWLPFVLIACLAAALVTHRLEKPIPHKNQTSSNN